MIMNRLPGYDKNLGRSELAAFLALGLAGATLTMLAFFSGLESAGGPNHSSVSAPRTEAVNQKQPNEPELTLTNVLFIRPPAASGQAPPAGSLAAPEG
jgi:hypothetical protein